MPFLRSLMWSSNTIGAMGAERRSSQKNSSMVRRQFCKLRKGGSGKDIYTPDWKGQRPGFGCLVILSKLFCPVQTKATKGLWGCSQSFLLKLVCFI